MVAQILLVLFYIAWYFTLRGFDVWSASFNEKIWPMIWTGIYVLIIVYVAAFDSADHTILVLFGVPNSVIWYYLLTKANKVTPTKNSVKLFISSALMVLLGSAFVVFSVLWK